ncbi:MAG: hypothetical protein ACXVZO_12215 [Gaiellaceae bacterium]
MRSYLGIVVEQSLTDPSFLQEIDVVASESEGPGSWRFLLVRIDPELLDEELARLRRALATDEPWYAHAFRDRELIVVFADALFWLTTDPASWSPAVEHGLAAGIPPEQLDFWPHTLEQARDRFGPLPELGPGA